MSALVEVQPAQQTDLGAVNARAREQQFAGLQRIASQAQGSPFPSIGVLGSGTYKGGTLGGIVDVTGLSQPRVTGEVTLLGSALVRGVLFEEELHIGGACTVAFAGCRFLKPIRVDAGGRIGCSGGCRFDGTSAIINAGVAADAASTGCVKTSATAHVNVTVTGEV